MMNGSKNLDKQWVCVPSQSVRVAARRGDPLYGKFSPAFVAMMNYLHLWASLSCCRMYDGQY